MHLIVKCDGNGSRYQTGSYTDFNGLAKVTAQEHTWFEKNALALAVARAARTGDVSVDLLNAWWRVEGVSYVAPLPRRARAAMRQLKMNRRIEPFMFQLEGQPVTHERDSRREVLAA